MSLIPSNNGHILEYVERNARVIIYLFMKNTADYVDFDDQLNIHNIFYPIFKHANF